MKLPSVTRVPRGIHHLILWRRVEGTLRRELPVLYLMGDPDAPPTPVLTLFDYSRAHESRSATWHLYRLRALGALIDFLVQNADVARPGREGTSGRSRARSFFRKFVKASVKGTIRYERGALVDDTGLFWRPMGLNEVKKRLEALQDVARWLDTEGYGHGLAETVAAEVPSDPSGALEFLYASQVVKRISLLSYLSKYRGIAPRYTKDIVGRDGSSAGAVLAFPESRVLSLLTSGFPDDPSALLNTLFMLGAGTRESEGLHAWVSDFQFVDGKAIMYLYHPSDSYVEDPLDGKLSRREYLSKRFDRVPRSDLLKGPEALGWKGVRGDINGATLYWLPGPGIAQTIGINILTYIKTVRTPIMRLRRQMGLPDHPYLLVSPSMNPPKGRHIGDPYTIGAFNSSWKQGVKRAFVADGLSPPIIAKANGNTPHACRHSYAFKLKELGLDGAYIQHCLHHINPFSHLVYIKPSDAAVNRVLNKAAEQGVSENWGLKRFLSTSEALAREMNGRFA